MTIDDWLKRIWLVIGILVCAGFLFAGVAFVIQFFTPAQRVSGPLVGQQAQPNGSDSLVRQNLSFDPPRPVGKTDWLYIGIRVRDLTTPIRASEMRKAKVSEYRDINQRSLVNVVFTKADGSVSYPLLDRKALIKSIDIPTRFDSLQRYHVYDIAFTDTDHDGRVTGEDSSQLYVSDITGRNLDRLTFPGDVIQWYEESPDYNRLFVAVKQRPSKDDVPLEDWSERLYVYDITGRKVSRFPTNDETFERIQRQLWEK